MGNKPNIVFILTDDQGAWALGCAGAQGLKTPHLDRIAAQGMRFTNFFCASPVCSPARASILTGRMPSAHGVHDWLRCGNVDAKKYAEAGRDNPYNHYADEDEPIEYLKDQRTYTDVLSDAGYQLALSGKWHLGDSVRPQHGFTRWMTIGCGGCYYCDPDIVENEKITVRHGEYVTDLITDRAVDFLGDMAGRAQPFYLAVHYTAPHSPWEKEQHPRALIDHYDQCAFEDIPDIPDHPDLMYGAVHGTPARHGNLRGYYAAITAMDAGVGRILERLEALGVGDDTVVIFASDNGMSMGHHGIWGKGNGTFPFNMYDTAVKVPFLVRWRGRVQPGTVCDEMVSAYDIFPTIADMIGAPEPDDPRRPGRSFLPILLGEKNDRVERDIVVFDEYGPVRMIRTRDWKYIHRYPYGAHELYHLADDPGETENLYGRPEYADTVVDLRNRLQKWFARYADPLRDGALEGVTGCGQMTRAGAASGKMTQYKPLPR